MGHHILGTNGQLQSLIRVFASCLSLCCEVNVLRFVCLKVHTYFRVSMN